MKRNTLMKRMAVVALAATMSIGMAVPAFAAVKEGDTTKEPTNGYYWEIQKDGNGYNSRESNEIMWHNYYLNTFANDAKYIDFGTDPSNEATSDNENIDEGIVISPNDGWKIEDLGPEAATREIEKKDPSTLKQIADSQRFQDYTVTVEDGEGNVTARVDRDRVYFTAKKFGTTRFHITRLHYYKGKHGEDKVIREHYFAQVTAKVSKDTVSEILDSVTPSIPSAQAATATDAEATAQKLFQDALDAKDPKYSKIGATDGLTTDDTKLNVPVKLTAHVNSIEDFHAATLQRDGWFYANVAVNSDSSNVVYGNKKIKFTIPQGNPYTDLDSSKYYYNNVVKALKDGVVTPENATTFGVNNDVSRADFVTWLWREAGKPQVTSVTHFKDIDSLSEETKNAISWATEQGYIDGWTASTFNPTHALTRAQVIQILWNMAGSPEGYNETTFSDMSHDAWYEEAVDWGTSKGVAKIAGYTDGTFRPTENVKKADAVEFLYRG